MLVILALGKLRQEDWEFEASIGYVMGSSLGLIFLGKEKENVWI
jgi:hypothetical protein